MTQPFGNCPGCGADEPFEQFHAAQCPDVDGDCPEWACVGCGAGVIMGTMLGSPVTTVTTVPARVSVCAA